MDAALNETLATDAVEAETPAAVVAAGSAPLSDWHQASQHRLDLAQVRAFETYEPVGIETILKQRQLRVIMFDESEVLVDETDEPAFLAAMDKHLGLA